MATGQMVVYTAGSQAGDPYVFGAEASPNNPNPRRFDCSELVEWACGRLGVSPRMPDGSKAQKAHCQSHKTLITVDQGIHTAGALLFRMSGNPTHVAISRGNGQTIEARGRAYGVGTFSAYGRRWTHAGRIPGVLYGQPAPVVQHATKQQMAYTALKYVKELPNLDPGNVSLHTIWLQRALNIATGTTLKDDGYYGDRTVLAVIAFQRWFNISPVDEPPGYAHEHTRWILAAALKAIAEGRA